MTFHLLPDSLEPSATAMYLVCGFDTQTPSKRVPYKGKFFSDCVEEDTTFLSSLAGSEN